MKTVPKYVYDAVLIYSKRGHEMSARCECIELGYVLIKRNENKVIYRDFHDNYLYMAYKKQGDDLEDLVVKKRRTHNIVRCELCGKFAYLSRCSFLGKGVYCSKKCRDKDKEKS